MAAWKAAPQGEVRACCVYFLFTNEHVRPRLRYAQLFSPLRPRFAEAAIYRYLDSLIHFR